jgi:hypothetical protein
VALLLLIVAQYPSRFSHKIGACAQVFPGCGNPGGGQGFWAPKYDPTEEIQIETASKNTLINYEIILCDAVDLW